MTLACTDKMTLNFIADQPVSQFTRTLVITMIKLPICVDKVMKVHMGPGNYGFFPLQFLPIIWPHYSLFKMEK